MENKINKVISGEIHKSLHEMTREMSTEMENIKRISEGEFKRMGGKIDFGCQTLPRQSVFRFVGLQKVPSRDGREWAFPLFEKKDEPGIVYAIRPPGFDIEN